MTTDQTDQTPAPEAPEPAIAAAAPLAASTAVRISDGYWFDPIRSVAIDDEEGGEIAVHLVDGVVVDADGAVYGDYDPEVDPESPELPGNPALAPTWAERMVARLGRHAVRRRILVAEQDRIDAAMKARVAELLDADEIVAELTLRRTHVGKMLARADGALAFLAAAYRPPLLRLAEERVGSAKRRTFDLLSGSLSLRKVPAKVRHVGTDEDAEAQTIEALLSLGEEEAVPREIKVARLSPELRAKLVAGKASVTGIEVVAETQEMTIKAGGASV